MPKNDQTIIPGKYTAVPRTLCFVTRGDQVLLLRGAADKPTWPGKLNGVGGHVEPDEDIHAAALREIEEETGLAVRHLLLRGVVNIPVDDRQNQGIVLFVFRAEATSLQARPSQEGRLTWVPRGRLAELAPDMVEDLPTLLPLALDAPPAAPPFFAHYAYDAHDQLVITFSP